MIKNISKIKREAAASAKNLLDKLNITSVPVDVYEIANILGVRVTAEELDENTSGVIVIKNNQAVVGVNKFHHPYRQRFTIAHELAHYILHKGNVEIFVDTALTFHRDSHSTEGTYDQEIAANSFAAELLMPKDIVQAYLKNQEIDLYDELVMKRLTSKFEVSEQALTIRLVNLGLISV